MVQNCPYQELGLKPGASDAQVKDAYRASARKWHPDTYRGPDSGKAQAQANFRRATEAYSSLIDAHAGLGTGGASAGAASGTTRDQNGQSTWRRQYARPKASRGAEDAANYWEARARAARPASYGHESEFHVPPGGRGARGRLLLGPLAFALGLGVCAYTAMRTEPEPAPRGSSAAGLPNEARTVDAVYNTKRRRWEQPHPSMYNDPLVASMIRQQPAASVHQPPRR